MKSNQAGTSLGPEQSRMEEEEKKLKSRRYITRASSKYKMRWDVFVILLAIYNSFTIPYDIAFSPPAFEDGIIEALNWTIDCLFLVDIIVGFRTTFIN